MKKRQTIKNILIVIFAFALLVTSCFTIMSVDQPDYAEYNEQITIKVLVRTEPDPAWGLINDGQYGIFAMMLPQDWFIDEVTYDSATKPDTSDLGPMVMEYLDPADPDGTPGDGTGKVDYWKDSLDVRYPVPAGMMWEVWQNVAEDSTQIDTGYVEVTVKVTVGQTAGDFELAYFVTMAALDFDWDYQYSHSPGHTIHVSPTAITDDANLPGTFSLTQNYPNPFNPQTEISFNLVKQGIVHLKVYDIGGREVATLANGLYKAGEHRLTFNAEDLSTGIYFYQIQMDNKVLTKKMILSK